MKQSKKYVICHDGTFEGDSTFDAAEFIPYVKGKTLKYYKDQWLKSNQDDMGEEDFLIDDYNNIKGAWVINHKTYFCIQNMITHFDGGNDSACYTFNFTLKMLEQNLAISFLGMKVSV